MSNVRTYIGTVTAVRPGHAIVTDGDEDIFLPVSIVAGRSCRTGQVPDLHVGQQLRGTCRREDKGSSRWRAMNVETESAPVAAVEARETTSASGGWRAQLPACDATPSSPSSSGATPAVSPGLVYDDLVPTTLAAQVAEICRQLGVPADGVVPGLRAANVSCGFDATGGGTLLEQCRRLQEAIGIEPPQRRPIKHALAECGFSTSQIRQLLLGGEVDVPLFDCTRRATTCDGRPDAPPLLSLTLVAARALCGRHAAGRATCVCLHRGAPL